jgi:preprotein translocase subunit YajC
MKKLYFILILLMWSMLQMNAQQVIMGQVKDNAGSPLIGASIYVMGTTTGTVTDADGKFSIRVNPGQKIQVSMVGFNSRLQILAIAICKSC